MIDRNVRAHGSSFRGVVGLLALGALSLTGSACGAGDAPAAATAAASSARGSPRDVSNFIARREQCDHFRGEEAHDAKRRATLEAKLKEFCTGTDAELAALKKKYSADKAVHKTLSRFDPSIE